MPTGVSWFEVDRSDVLRAKQKALKQSGAAFSQHGNKKGAPAYSRSPCAHALQGSCRYISQEVLQT